MPSIFPFLVDFFLIRLSLTLFDDSIPGLPRPDFRTNKRLLILQLSLRYAEDFFVDWSQVMRSAGPGISTCSPLF